MTKTEKLLTALQNGQRVTIKQAVHRYGFASKNSLTGTISHLRDSGIRIAGEYTRDLRGRERFKYFIA